ncbi:MAG: hypothetical protein CFH15_00877 [Alphaproteobacteria bacterium MarineAlpha5_Bin5]|nr:MAG: hypothetical protein CFH15_00877 [Alphaproteobacteria bacterium MarineAlpha5_Bin5]PPR52049.1 MAG: hypothetical protein CFH14_00543 [Alphaproteobacteria bacterium MarineAlpha5_Bin4]|tara:strand:+ start:938 stop:1141 length:204 start_codon:yes stop_codon:yes gene_type:complete
MLKLLLLGIGLVLVFEGLLYFVLASKLHSILENLKKIDSQLIKTISVVMIAIGTCLIYFTFRLYGEL